MPLNKETEYFDFSHLFQTGLFKHDMVIDLGEEKSEFKLVKLRLIFDLVSHSAQEGEGLC